MKKIYSIISLLVIALILSGCNDSSSKILDDTNDKDTNILIAFYDDESTAIEKNCLIHSRGSWGRFVFNQ